MTATFLPGFDLAEAHSCNQSAGVWMKRGIALLEENTTASLGEAVRYFDQAIELRSALPLHADAWFRYCLAAGWMNRGDALTRLGSSETLESAVRSYDEALKHLHLLPLDQNPLYRKRLAIAWLNRGITLVQRRKPVEASRSFDEGIAQLQHPAATALPEQRQLLGCAWMNRGNALLRLDKPDLPGARASSKQALEILASTERAEIISAEAGLKARHVLCQAIAPLLEAAPGGGQVADELLAEASDAVDSGMELARQWEARGVARFRILAEELFRFGARAYQTHQPHFLAEFILESLDPAQSSGTWISPEMLSDALRALWRAVRRLEADGFKRPSTPEFDQFLEKLGQFSAAEKRLHELRHG